MYSCSNCNLTLDSLAAYMAFSSLFPALSYCMYITQCWKPSALTSALPQPQSVRNVPDSGAHGIYKNVAIVIVAKVSI